MNVTNNKKKINTKVLIACLIAIILIVICVVVVISINGSSNKETKDDTKETTTTEALYYGNILSANENWIGMYDTGELVGCVYNYDKTGVYETNGQYSCSDGVTCCTGDMEVEYAFNGGSALGGGLPDTNVIE